ncbi:MAG: aminoglycoside phosphotransferase family protein [Alphaproteobacteria bacterium]|nr:aminoglycoside phosphotransferase family protein [Alphaproteobacteria bacterium]
MARVAADGGGAHPAPMGEARVYSERLGAISDAQFAAMAERWGLGRFLGAAPVTSGLFGQNVFVTTGAGDFVLRGAPHWVPDGGGGYRPEDRWQFTKERHFAQQLHEKTRVPVPWPMLHDTANDIFGWPYLVMPRMPGLCTDERSILKTLTAEDRRGVAAALGAMLAQMQMLTSPFAGDFGTESIALEPYPGGAVAWIAQEARRLVRSCGERLTADEAQWVEAAIAEAGAGAGSSYVHCDYKFGNLTLLKEGGAWRVSGLFDFHEARFSDGALDLVRSACSYLDTEGELAAVFRAAYGRPLDAGRMRLYVLNDRLKIWDYFTRPGVQAPWLTARHFRPWAERYVEGVVGLV